MKHIVDTGRLPDGLDLLSFCDGLVFFARPGSAPGSFSCCRR